jgi:uncharacterized protein YjbI with pentapeptide repeats
MWNSAALELDSAELLRMRLWGQRLGSSEQGGQARRRSPDWGAAGAQGGRTHPSTDAFCSGAAIAPSRTTVRSDQPTVVRRAEIDAAKFQQAELNPPTGRRAGAAMTAPQSSAHALNVRRETSPETPPAHGPWTAIAPRSPLKLVPELPAPPSPKATLVPGEPSPFAGPFGESFDGDCDFEWLDGDEGPESFRDGDFSGQGGNGPRDRADQNLHNLGGQGTEEGFDAAEAIAQLSQLLTDMADSVAKFNGQCGADAETFLDLGDAMALEDDGVLLTGVNLDGAALEGCDLSGEGMQRASLVAANLTAAILNRTNLEGATLTRACLTRTIAIAASFEMAKMDEIQAQLFQGRGGNFNYAKLRRSRLDLGDFERGRFDFASLRGSSAIEASFSAASMQYANLSGGRFIRTDFRGTDLRQANFTGADLRGARLASADLTGATLTNAVLVGAKYSSQTLWPQGFDAIAAGAVLGA